MSLDQTSKRQEGGLVISRNDGAHLYIINRATGEVIDIGVSNANSIRVYIRAPRGYKVIREELLESTDREEVQKAVREGILLSQDYLKQIIRDRER